jgi:hypothetical protein
VIDCTRRVVKGTVALREHGDARYCGVKGGSRCLRAPVVGWFSHLDYYGEVTAIRWKPLVVEFIAVIADEQSGSRSGCAASRSSAL